MDVLSQVLSSVRVKAAAFFTGEFTAPWTIASAGSAAIAALLPGVSEPFVAHHLLVEGRAWAQIDGEECIALEPGDLVVVPRGDAHVLSSRPIEGEGPGRITDAALPAMTTGGSPVVRGGGGGATTRFVCGFLACDPETTGLLRHGLAPLVRIGLRGDDAGQWLVDVIRHLASDPCWLGRTRSVLITKMAEALLVEALRRHASQLPPGESGWLDGARDPVVSAVLALFHRRPSHSWTVVDLAAAVAVSRSVLYERFLQCVGEPPLRYLGRFRLQLAARLLKTTRTSILQVASDVGYTSEAAFNRAFKREFGMPPAQYRRARAGASTAGRGRPSTQEARR